MLQVKLEEPTADNSCLIQLSLCLYAIVDKPIPRNLLAFKWRAVLWNYRWYAFATQLLDGTPYRVSMHRLVADTPPGEVCHHYTKNSLDNRRANLLNQIPLHHRQLHKIRRFGRKHDNKI